MRINRYEALVELGFDPRARYYGIVDWYDPNYTKDSRGCGQLRCIRLDTDNWETMEIVESEVRDSFIFQKQKKILLPKCLVSFAPGFTENGLSALDIRLLFKDVEDDEICPIIDNRIRVHNNGNHIVRKIMPAIKRTDSFIVGPVIADVCNFCGGVMGQHVTFYCPGFKVKRSLPKIKRPSLDTANG